MSRDTRLRQHLINLMTARQAHVTLDDALRDLPAQLRGERPQGMPYSPWELVEHLRVAQHDILDFCRNPEYEQPSWPDDYWPDAPAPDSKEAWTESVAQIRRDLESMCGLVRNPDLDLYAEIPHGNGQTYLREAMLVADHNAYHVGQLVAVRRLLGAWPPEEGDA
jgi:uncharacterized damage-inducible protein DinB